MTTQNVLQKIVRSLHRSLFHSVPNSGPQEVDLSRLRPIQNMTHQRPIFNLQFTQQAQITSSKIKPEPWDINE